MTYRIVISPAARRQLNALPEGVAWAVMHLMEAPLRENPHRVGKALTDGLDGLHGAHRGTYRILYRIDDNRIVVTVIKIGHRRGIYHS